MRGFLRFSPDGETLLTWSRRCAARLWDAHSGRALGPAISAGHWAWAFDFSPGAKAVVTAGWEGIGVLRDSRSGRPIGRPLNHRGWIRAVSFSQDGKRVLTGGEDGTARIWDAESGAPVGPALEHGKSVYLASWSPDGAAVFTASESQGLLWDAATGKTLGAPLGHEGWIRESQFSADGRRLATLAGAKTLQLWDARSGERIGYASPVDEDRLRELRVSLDGRTAAALGEKAAWLWDLASGDLPCRRVEHGYRVEAVAISPKMRLIATGSMDETARLWAYDGAGIKTRMDHASQVASVAFSPDGRTVVTSSFDRAKLWRVPTCDGFGRELRHPGGIWALSFSPNGRTIAACDAEGVPCLWNAADGEPLASPSKASDYSGQRYCLPPEGPFDRERVDWDYGKEELERIRSGLTAQSMENKWCGIVDGDYLFIHRSWTGFLCYIAHLGGRGIDAVWHWRDAPTGWRSELVRWIIEARILGRKREFPLR